eukprot:11694-Heterococcus_DN1.PRE.2
MVHTASVSAMFDSCDSQGLSAFKALVAQREHVPMQCTTNESIHCYCNWFQQAVVPASELSRASTTSAPVLTERPNSVAGYQPLGDSPLLELEVAAAFNVRTTAASDSPPQCPTALVSANSGSSMPRTLCGSWTEYTPPPSGPRVVMYSVSSSAPPVHDTQ